MNIFSVHHLIVHVLVLALVYLPFSVGADEQPDISSKHTITTQTKIAFTHIQLATDAKIRGSIADYLVSEKLDGVRGFWDGKKMLSRSGRVIPVPRWFVKHFPSYPLDGELWMGRETFEQMSALARRKVAVDEDWRGVKFMVFDLPASSEKFELRYKQAKSSLGALSVFMEVIEHKRIVKQAKLETWLEEVIDAGGEGLMLHRENATYQSGRNSDLIKLKPYYDAEASVLAYQAGKGKFEGMMGSILVENSEGVTFKIGTGFTIKERMNPPSIGAIVTYQYSGLTQKGTPRFARYLRVRFEQ